MNTMNAQVEADAEQPRASSNEGLCRRLVLAKIQLDRLERDGTSNDLSALSAARVEFALASRALADALIAQEGEGQLHHC